MPTVPALADILPGGALRQGAAYSVDGSTTLVMALLLVIRGILERSPEGVTNLIADKFESLTVAAQTTSRDFR